jgi:thioredoxin reductase (NADPH)
MIYDLLIIGSGPAGLTAAIYASRADIKTLILGGSAPGGQLTLTTDVENYPGFPRGITGPQLIADTRAQAERFGTQIINHNVTQVNFKKIPFTLTIETKETYQAKSAIVATGASARWLNLPSEQKLRGKGVSACATCDGFFFKDKVVAVVGGGDTAMEEALFLTKFATKVFIIHRRDAVRASKIMQQRVLNHPKVEVVWNSQVQEVLGKDKVTGLKLLETRNSKLKTIPVDGVFIAVGHQPDTDFLKGHLNLDQKGYVKVSTQITNFTHTSVPGVFAAGDCVDYHYRQAVTAAGMGCMAALDAEKWLDENS